MILLLGTITGCKGCDAIHRFADGRRDERHAFLALPGGIPSADTLRRVSGADEPAALTHVLITWASSHFETFEGKANCYRWQMHSKHD